MRFLFVRSSLVIFAHTTHSRKYGFATEIEKLLEKQVEDQATKRIFLSYQFVCSTASSRKKKYTKSSNENEATKSGEFNWVESYCWVLRGFLKIIGSTPVKSATVPAYRSSWTSTEVELCQGLNGASPKPEKIGKISSNHITLFISFSVFVHFGNASEKFRQINLPAVSSLRT